jgi:hypothetical protein
MTPDPRAALAARLQRIDPNGVWSDVACALEDMPTPTMEELVEAYERLTAEGQQEASK